MLLQVSERKERCPGKRTVSVGLEMELWHHCLLVIWYFGLRPLD